MTSFCCPTVRDSVPWCHCAILSRSRADTIARAAPWRGTVGDTVDTTALLRCTILYTAPYSTQSAVCWCRWCRCRWWRWYQPQRRREHQRCRDAHLISRPSTISSSSDLSGPDNSHQQAATIAITIGEAVKSLRKEICPNFLTFTYRE